MPSSLAEASIVIRIAVACRRSIASQADDQGSRRPCPQLPDLACLVSDASRSASSASRSAASNRPKWYSIRGPNGQELRQESDLSLVAQRCLGSRKEEM